MAASGPSTFTYAVRDVAAVSAVAVGWAGNIYLTGNTSSSVFPATPGAFQTKYGGGMCVSYRRPTWRGPIFLAMTREYSTSMRRALAWRIAMNSLFLLVGSYFIGTHILSFFGISLPVVKYPDTGKLTYTYCDQGTCSPMHSVTATALQNSCTTGAATNSIVTDDLYDGLGRATTHQLHAGSDIIYTSKVFDNLGRVFQQSNPSTSLPSPPSTQIAYDALSRPVLTTAPDGAKTYTGYAGNQTFTRDPAKKWRKIANDAAGRLTQVVEDETAPATSSDAQPNPFAYLKDPDLSHTGTDVTTNYRYGALDNLLGVCQGASFNPAGSCTGTQARTFGYDALGRLTSATNPESGLISYTYDNNGNLVSSKDAGGAVRCNGTVDASGNCTAAYDGLNRPAGRTYFPAGTPAVTYTYDDPAVPNSFGRLTATSTAASTTSILAYDAVGRVTQSKQKTGATPYPFSYSYNLAGDLETETYPSGRAVTTCYDSGGRVATVSGKATSTSTAVPYATVKTYAPHAGITQMKLGNNLYEGASYNLRLQAASMTLGTSAGGSDLWSITNDYGISLNNANLLSQAITASGMTGTLKQYFTYDPLNRLQVAVENPAAGNVASPVCPDKDSQWCQQFSYDLFGNRTVAQSSFIGTVIGQPMGFSLANNRITDSGYGYDAAGNLNLSPLAFTYAYDAENRLVVACPNDPTPSNCVNTASNGRTLYGYDGDGKRVTKQAASGTVTMFVYDAMGGLAAEYSSAPVTPAVAGTIYLTTDHLGSTRVVTDSSGRPLPVARHDYRPFGEEISFNAGNPRQGVQGYAQDAGVRQEFTGQERDAETGLDYFEARYFSSTQGRFTGPDDPLADQWEEDPQSWNLFSYGRNNPLRYIDPTGRACVVDPKTGVEHDDQSGGQSCAEATAADKTKKPDETVISAPLAPTWRQLFLDRDFHRAINQQVKLDIESGRAQVVRGEIPIGPPAAAAGSVIRSIWSSTNKLSAVRNAFAHWLKHGRKFPHLQNAKQYVDEALEFVTNPPAGTLSKLRANGDTVLYNPATNTFAVTTAAGAPRTMFKPSGNGMTYFNAQ
jgi:RHS repeat-associated protein